MNPWLEPAELRIGLGCMRLPAGADDARAAATDTLAAALAAGVTVFDTARAYAPAGAAPGHNERLVAEALRAAPAGRPARIVTKGGMARPGGRWVPDGRARAIRADCEASLAALGGLGIDLYLIHAPDPRTPWRTTVRTLARLVDDGLVARVGVANVTRAQLDEALALAPIAAVQAGLGVLDDAARRGGILERCEDAGIALMAHSPLGGPRRVGRLRGHPALASVAESHEASAAEVALAWLLGLSPCVVPIPGARSAAAARSAARATAVGLRPAEQTAISAAFGWTRPRPRRSPRGGEREVVLVMGIPGSGKTRVAEAYATGGFVRLNRDERGGSLRGLATALDKHLGSDPRPVVVDSTYLTRAARSHVVEAAARHGLRARCVWLDTPLADAQVNVIERLLDRFGRLPDPDELAAAARTEAGLLAPTAQMRARRGLEPPAADEGFAAVERVPFVREAAAGGRGGVLVAAAVLRLRGWEKVVAAADSAAAHLVFDWTPGAPADALAAESARLAELVSGPVEHASCPHPAGPPICWCRPPLPGLPMAFARAHGLQPAACTLVGASAAHRALARALGARYVAADAPSP